MQLTDTQCNAINTANISVDLTVTEFMQQHTNNLAVHDIGGLLVCVNEDNKLAAFYDYELLHYAVFERSIA